MLFHSKNAPADDHQPLITKLRLDEIVDFRSETVPVNIPVGGQMANEPLPFPALERTPEQLRNRTYPVNHRSPVAPLGPATGGGGSERFEQRSSGGALTYQLEVRAGRCLLMTARQQPVA